MPTNFPGPYEVRIKYTTAIAGQPTYNHELRLSVNLSTTAVAGSPFGSFVVEGRSLATQNLAIWTDALVVLLRPLFDANADINDAELWLYDVGTFNAAFQSTYPIALAGTGGGSGLPDGQFIITFRSTSGGSARVDLRRCVLAAGITQSFPTASTPINNLAAFIVDADNGVIARDGGWVFTPLHYLPGTNERMFKDRLRP